MGVKLIGVKPAEVEVPEGSPFANDALGREASATILAQFVRRISAPYVLALDSPWGTGKTTFLRMWVQLLRNSGMRVLYFNAWETDFSEDPFVALVGELSAAVAALGYGNAAVHPNVERMKKLAMSVAKRAIPVAIRIGTAGVLDLDKDTEKELAGLAGDVAKDRIKEYEHQKASIAEFRAALTETVQGIRDGSECLAPLVFVIDELDRCRPTYAISLLEKVKHLFSVPGMAFILALDKAQLLHSIRSVYGIDFDARGYLRRFIDMEYRLPEPPPGDYIKHILDRLGVVAHFAGHPAHLQQGELTTIRDLLERLVQVVGSSLREQVQCVSRLWVTLNTIPDNEKLFDIELVTMTVLREWRPDLFHRFEVGEITHQEVLDALKAKPSGRAFLSEHEGHLVEAVLACGAAQIAEDDAILRHYQFLADDQAADGHDREHASKVFQCMNYVRRFDRGSGMKLTLKRLSLSQNFISRESQEAHA